MKHRWSKISDRFYEADSMLRWLLNEGLLYLWNLKHAWNSNITYYFTLKISVRLNHSDLEGWITFKYPFCGPQTYDKILPGQFARITRVTIFTRLTACVEFVFLFFNGGTSVSNLRDVFCDDLFVGVSPQQLIRMISVEKSAVPNREQG